MLHTTLLGSNVYALAIFWDGIFLFHTIQNATQSFSQLPLVLQVVILIISLSPSSPGSRHSFRQHSAELLVAAPPRPARAKRSSGRLSGCERVSVLGEITLVSLRPVAFAAIKV